MFEVFVGSNFCFCEYVVLEFVFALLYFKDFLLVNEVIARGGGSSRPFGCILTAL